MNTAVKTLPAGMPLPRLLDRLNRAGGGGLGKRHRAMLAGLAIVLPHRSAHGKATTLQLADYTGYSQRWVRHTLLELEDVGLLTWQRGGVVDGKPTPSVFRVCKTALCDLIAAGRTAYAALLATRQRQTAARLAGLGPIRAPRRHHRRSVHAELGSHLSSTEEVTGGGQQPAAPPDDDQQPPATPASTREHARAIRDMLRRLPRSPK